MKAVLQRTCRWLTGRRGLTLEVFLVACTSALSAASADYVETFQTWTATSADTWGTQDLSGAPYNVPANAVVEVAIRNLRFNTERWGGVRAVGSSLDRRFLLHEAEDGGLDVVVMHVQTDSNSRIEHYADDTYQVAFYLLGYWTCGTYVEVFQSFKAGADTSWEDHNLNAYGVGISNVAEIVLVNNSGIDEREAGVRTNGSSLSRIIDLHEADGGGYDVGTMFVEADATANATIEVYAESNADVDFYLVGYWSAPPGTYTETYYDPGAPSADATWENLDLSGEGVSSADVVEMVLGNGDVDEPNEIGVRTDGSSLDRLLDLHEANNGGGEFVRMHVAADADAEIEYYFEDVSDTHTFRMVGYWGLGATVFLSDHITGQETNAFSGSGGETDAELFAFELDSGLATVSVTQLVFTLSDIATLTDGDWGGIEIIVDGDDSGDVDNGESTKVGGDGVVNTAAGTVTFSTSINITGATSYILRADFSSLTQCNAVKISLTVDNTTTTACKAGSTTPVTHAESGIVEGLVGHWKLDDAAGGTAVDAADTNDGTITGATWADGRLCGALDFDGSGDYVDMGSVHDFTDGEDFTITGWFNRVSFNTDDVIVGKRNSATWGSGYIVFVDNGDNLIFDIGDGSDEFTMTSATTFTSSGWNHFAVVFDEDSAANSKIYINGSDDNESQTGTIGNVGSLSNVLAFRIGAEADGGSGFEGRIDDIRVYDRALSQTDIEALAATYKIIDLGSVSEERSLAYSVNDSEQIAGYDEDSGTGDTDAWRAENCTFTSLGTFAGGSVAESLGINSDGEVVGWSDNAAGNRKAFFYDGSLTDLGSLTDRTESEANAVNASSEVVGTAYNSGTPPTDRMAFIYLPAPAYTLGAGINSLGTLGGYRSVAMDINDSGQVVGGSENASEYMRPFRWQNGTMTDLGSLGGEVGFVTHRANAINSPGNVVGTSYTAGEDAHAFFWDGSMTDLGVLTGGDTSWALDINDSNEVVGTSNVTGGAFHAFIWDSTDGMRDLNDLIDTNSSWTLIRATSINKDGEIVGWGTNGSGAYHAFLLIQTCSGSGPSGGIASASTLLGSSAGQTDSNGDLEEVISDTEGIRLAQIIVADAEPDKHFAMTVTAPGPDSIGAPGPGEGTLAGFDDGFALDRTFTIKSAAQPGTLSLTVAMYFQDYELAEVGVAPEDVELHVLDTTQGPSPGVWVPAGMNIGQSEPTGIVGESGFLVHTDDSVDFWAVRDAPGVFAVGAKSLTQDDHDDADDGGVTPDPLPIPPVCGLGIIPFTLAAMVTLISARTRRRLSHSH